MARKSQKAVQSRKKKNRAEKRSRHLNRNVTNLSAKALDVLNAESCVQLDLSDGPISRLPNELVQSILARFEMQELIPMQVVCQKWQAVIYSIGHTKKSLFVADLGYSDEYYDKHEDVKKRTFGQIYLNTFTCIQIKSNSSEHFPSKLVELFPNLEQLVVRLQSLPDILLLLELFPSTQVTTLSIIFAMYEDDSDFDRVPPLLNRINLYTSLKVLDIWVRFELLSTLAPTLARLKHFSCHRSYSVGYEDILEASDKEVVTSLVRHFSPNCSRVNLRSYAFTNCSQWPTINGQWLANVTHLELNNVFDEHNQAIRILSEHAISLQVLGLSFLQEDLGFTPLTSRMIGHLQKLKRLTELFLAGFLIDLAHMGEAVYNFQFTPLKSIRSLTMFQIRCENNSARSDSDLLTLMLSAIFPNVQHLNIVSYTRLDGVEQYLGRFAHLQTHSFQR